MDKNSIQKLGNDLGCYDLKHAGYNIEKIEEKKTYYICTKDDESIVVKIISRKKYEISGNENTNINTNVDEEFLEEYYTDYKVYTLTVIIDDNTYSSYLHSYNHKKQIKINEYYEGNCDQIFSQNEKIPNSIL